MRREQQLIGFEETSRFPQACFKLLCQRLAQKVSGYRHHVAFRNNRSDSWEEMDVWFLP